LVVLAASAVCFAVGHFVAGTWTQELVDVLGSAGVTLVVTDPVELRAPLWMAAAAIATSGPAAALSAGVAARVAGRPPTIGPYLRALGMMFLGANLGIGAKAITLARIVVPRAVEASAAGDPLTVPLAELSLWPWALAGVAGALIIHGSVAAVMAMLSER
jgi:hypothetical protein